MQYMLQIVECKIRGGFFTTGYICIVGTGSKGIRRRIHYNQFLESNLEEIQLLVGYAANGNENIYIKIVMGCCFLLTASGMLSFIYLILQHVL